MVAKLVSDAENIVCAAVLSALTAGGHCANLTRPK